MTDLSLQSRIEFALRDAGFSNREAATLAKRAAAVPDRERVARAIAGALGGNPRVGELPPSWMKAADAAIAAMGETP